MTCYISTIPFLLLDLCGFILLLCLEMLFFERTLRKSLLDRRELEGVRTSDPELVLLVGMVSAEPVALAMAAMT